MMSSEIRGSNIFSNFLQDLWFPQDRWYLMSVNLSFSDISLRGEVAPLVRISFSWGQNGWWQSSSSRSLECLNSEPYERILECIERMAFSKLWSFSSRIVALWVAASLDLSNLNNILFNFFGSWLWRRKIKSEKLAWVTSSRWSGRKAKNKSSKESWAVIFFMI